MIPDIVLFWCHTAYRNWGKTFPRQTLPKGENTMSKMSETHNEKMERKKMERASGPKVVTKDVSVGELMEMMQDGKIATPPNISPSDISDPSGPKIARKTVVKLSDVKTPTTVEEFRENLSRFFLKDGGTNNLMGMGGISIPIDTISSFDDIYSITGTGFSGDGSSPSITPTVDFSMDDVKDFMDRTGQVMTFTGFFENEDNFTLYDNQMDFVQDGENVKFYTLDNQIIREFYSKILGDFSGYRGSAWVDDTRSKYVGSLLGKKVA